MRLCFNLIFAIFSNNIFFKSTSHSKLKSPKAALIKARIYSSLEKFGNAFRKIQTRIFNNLKYLMKKKCLLMVEFRTDKDPLKNFGKRISKSERYTNHYRRFINLAEFEKIINE